MHKITFLLVILAISVVGFAQEITNLKHIKTPIKEREQIKKANKPKGTIYFSEDFSSDAWQNSVVVEGDGFLHNPNGTMPAGWTSVDAAYNGSTPWQNAGYFHWSNVGPRGSHTTGTDNDPFTPDNNLFNGLPEGTTFDNGVLLLESNFANTTENGGVSGDYGPLDSYIQYGPLDLSNAPGAIFSCNTIYRFCCQGDALLSLEVSIDYDPKNPDNGNWEVFELNKLTTGNDYTFESNTHFPISEREVEINLSELVAGSDNVWFRIRQSKSSFYFWILDDISIYETKELDLKLTDGFADYALYPVQVSSDPATNFFGGYTAIPERVAAPFVNFRNAIVNNGTTDVTGAQLTLQISKDGSVVYNAKGLKKDIAKFAYDTVEVSTDYTPTDQGFYQVSLTTVFDGGQASNDWSYVFNVTNTVYSTVYHNNSDNYGTAGPSDWEVGGYDGDACAQEYYIPLTAGETKATGINVFIPDYEGYDNELADIANGYFAMIAKIWKIDEEGEIVPSDIRSGIYNISTSDLGKWVSLNFEDEGNLWLDAGNTYFAGVECYTGHDPNSDRRYFLLGKDIYGPKQPYGGGLIYLSNGNPSRWGGTGDNYAIELNISTWNVDVATNPTATIEMYPNPFNNTLTINNLDEVKQVIISNVVGQSIKVIDVNQTSLEISTSDLKPGIYMVSTIDNNNKMTTNRIVKQ